MSRRIDPADHLEWAARIARKVARTQFVRGHEVEDLVSAATVALCEYAARSPADGGFDPAKAVDADLAVSFRVRAYLFLYGKVVDAAQELQGGGTFRTVRAKNLRKVGVLGDSAGEIVAVDPEPLPPVRAPAPEALDRPPRVRLAGLTLSGRTAERLARLLAGPRDFRAKARPAPPTVRRPVALSSPDPEPQECVE